MKLIVKRLRCANVNDATIEDMNAFGQYCYVDGIMLTLQ